MTESARRSSKVRCIAEGVVDLRGFAARFRPGEARFLLAASLVFEQSDATVRRLIARRRRRALPRFFQRWPRRLIRCKALLAQAPSTNAEMRMPSAVST